MDNRVQMPLKMQDGPALKRFVCMLASKQDLLQMALGLPGPLVESTWADALVIEEVQSLWEFHDRWNGDVTPGIQFDWDAPSMDLTIEGLTPEQHASWAQLVERVWIEAKRVRWALTRRASLDNPRYALRTWFLRLGMKGDVYKDTRRVLIEPLSGNTAFRRRNR